MRHSNDCKRIGIIGGSFDPIHEGHLNIAEQARMEFHLDEVWFIPAGHSPNKCEYNMTPAAQRARMVSLAISQYPYFKLSRIELEAEETSYTYLTLSKLVNEYPNKEFYFIMGADSLDYFEQWRYPEIICQKAIILTAVRDDMDIAQIEQKIEELKSLFQAEIYPIQGGRTDISSTALRQQLTTCRMKPKFLPDAVWKYICEQGLYGRKSEKQE